MPRASDYLRQKWGSHEQAYEQLRPNFTDDRGVLRPKAGYTPTAEDYSAIDYLCDEWDYGYKEN